MNLRYGHAHLMIEEVLTLKGIYVEKGYGIGEDRMKKYVPLEKREDFLK